jgi:hypothetical protein
LSGQIGRADERTQMRQPFFLARHSILAICLCSSAGALAQTTAFTYQGRLTDNSLAPTAIYDMQFTLYDGAGVQVGLPVTIATVQVTNGLFTVQINAAGEFGPNAFTGADRFLEVSVRHPGDPAYTPLTPRPQLTSAPYAVRSNEAAKAASFTAPLAGDVSGTQ